MIRIGDVLIINNLLEYGELGGLLEGYLFLKVYMGILFFSWGEFVVMIGIVNCFGGFDLVIRQVIEFLLVIIFNFVSVYCMECVCEQVIVDFNDSQCCYDFVVQGSVLGVWEFDVCQNVVFLLECLLDIVGWFEIMLQMGSGLIDNSVEVFFGFVYLED